MEKERGEMIVPKENAVFKLDEHGKWHHFEQGPFENKRIIAYFHSCIRKDEKGYFLLQEHKHFTEKVYFPYDDTALFVFNVHKKDGITLVLNTGRTEQLEPKNLFIENDNLYVQIGEHRVRFTEHALVRISDHLEFDEDENTLFIMDGEQLLIPERAVVEGRGEDT